MLQKIILVNLIDIAYNQLMKVKALKLCANSNFH